MVWNIHAFQESWQIEQSPAQWRKPCRFPGKLAISGGRFEQKPTQGVNKSPAGLMTKSAMVFWLLAGHKAVTLTHASLQQNRSLLVQGSEIRDGTHQTCFPRKTQGLQPGPRKSLITVQNLFTCTECNFCLAALCLDFFHCKGFQSHLPDKKQLNIFSYSSRNSNRTKI